MSEETQFYILPLEFYLNPPTKIKDMKETSLPTKASLYFIKNKKEIFDINSLNLGPNEYIYAKKSVEVNDIDPKIINTKKSSCKYEIVTDIDLNTRVRLIKLCDLIDLINEGIYRTNKDKVNQLEFYVDNIILDSDDLIYTDGMYFDYSSNHIGYRKTLRRVQEISTNKIGYFSKDLNKTIIHKQSLITNSSRKVLTIEDFHKLKSLIESDTNDNFEIAMRIIGLSNINKSFHMITILINKAVKVNNSRCYEYFKKNKEFKQYNLNQIHNLDNIVNHYKKNNAGTIDQDILDFLCDNYEPQRTEYSAMFKFKAVLK